METGKIVVLISLFVVGIIFGSGVGYKVGKAAGSLETATIIEKSQIAQQEAALSDTTDVYGNVQSNPLSDVQVNPFDY